MRHASMDPRASGRGFEEECACCSMVLSSSRWRRGQFHQEILFFLFFFFFVLQRATISRKVTLSLSLSFFFSFFSFDTIEIGLDWSRSFCSSWRRDCSPTPVLFSSPSLLWNYPSPLQINRATIYGKIDKSGTGDRNDTWMLWRSSFFFFFRGRL